ncbi:MAG: outer membrane protein assembly factor BamA [Gammaproteobacteria bacterium]|nr:outer membrane protein assembly factor BamA [Gammaproteobacteria bacterium]
MKTKAQDIMRYAHWATVGLLTLGLWVSAMAAEFVVRDIRIEGLRRISAGTIFNYLPVKVGDYFDESQSGSAIRTLFKTGFFKDVRIERDGDVLVVHVVERPSIDSITFEGNENLETEKLLDSLQQIGFAKGEVFNRSSYAQVEQELRRAYFAQGKYAVRIKSTVTPLERNRVAVNFDISEGRVATIKKINVVGNSVFDDDELTDLFQLSTTGWWAFLTKRDQYSKPRLAADLETLRSYYLDRGYINFRIDSTQVSISPDKQDVYITINVTEGDRFRVSSVDIIGDLVVAPQELTGLVVLRQGDVFSRKKVTESTTALATRLGQEGYSFANVNAVPDIDNENRQVKVSFFVDPGKRVYVRRITFKGNAKTRDEVLRREMRQLEGAWIDTSKVERSKTRLERLGFFDAVNVETPAVPGTQDQVDVEITVEERSSGNLLAGIGYSQTQGFIFNSEIAQENFLGTGNRVSVTFNNSDVNRAFGLGFTNPYFTDDGVSLGFEADYRETDAADANLSRYTLDEIQGAFNFGIPITEFDFIDLGVRVEHTRFSPGSNASNEIVAFDRSVDGEFLAFLGTASFARDTRNRRILPDKGSVTRLSGEVAVPGGDITYFKTELYHQQFVSLLDDYTLILEGEIGYGDGYGDTDSLPLTDNFFAGGIRSVRGFKANTLGPRDSLNEPFGGNFKMVGSAEIVLPVPFLSDIKQFRLTGFFDIGNVYGDNQDFDLGDLRYSTGLGAIYLSPLGALTFSWGVPLKTRGGDETESFQFTFGTSF